MGLKLETSATQCAKVFLAVLCVFLAWDRVAAQQPAIKPRTAIATSEVIHQKLRTYGVTNVTGLTRVGDTYVAKANYDNRPVELEIHALTGVIREKGKLEPLKPSATAPVRMIRDNHIKVNREHLVRPELTNIHPQ